MEYIVPVVLLLVIYILSRLIRIARMVLGEAKAIVTLEALLIKKGVFSIREINAITESERIAFMEDIALQRKDMEEQNAR